MTQQFEDLKAFPQTEINLTTLTPDERSIVRRVNVHSGPGRTKYTTVYFIQGDEKRAAEKFTEVNKDELKNIDFSKNRNEVQSNIDREIYDWILHALGERNLQKFSTVVVEKRPDGTIWVIDRDHFDKATARRYSISDQGTARIQDATLKSIYEDFSQIITESDLRDVDAIEGDVRYVLDAYRSMSEFNCNPISSDGELAIQKVS